MVLPELSHHGSLDGWRVGLRLGQAQLHTVPEHLGKPPHRSAHASKKLNSLSEYRWGDGTSRNDVSPYECSGTPGPKIKRPW